MSKISNKAETNLKGESGSALNEPGYEGKEMFDEVRDIMAHPEKYKQYDSAEEMMKDILDDADQNASDNM